MLIPFTLDATMYPSAKTILLKAAILTGFALFGPSGTVVFAQAPTTNQPWAYLLVGDSYLLDDCPVCDRAVIQIPLRGTFDLRLLEANSLSSLYAVENIQFTAGDRPYRITGSGTFEIGGDFALTQDMSLQLQIDDGFTNRLCYFTNSTMLPDRHWPMIDATVNQTNGTLTQTYTLRLAAAPVREIWFSTTNFFIATSGPAASEGVMSGDLLSTAGRIVKRNADLFTSVGAYPPAPDLGLDAVDMLPGGEIAFSLRSDITSNTLGPLQHGDLLSTKGRIIRRNQELLAPFGIQPPAPDVGLDAVQVLDTGEILFSIQSNIFSEQLSASLHRGDLLSSTGAIARNNQQLLARFQPTNSASDYGLDALYVWSSGETWFSTEDGFQDKTLGPISGGDLLSDQGYIVFRNADLLNAFAPTNAPPDLGLDALYVITDDIAPAPAPALTIQVNSTNGTAGLTWQGLGRVFQLERADDVAGPYLPFSPLLPDLDFDDAGALTNRSQSYYRLRQW
ncbi:MAG TPA: hypothetical protein VN887_18840 [Candidatus Angelobacter sp.]|nr:hypothetical protein [Candidatus Angelobacter sp.]